MLISVTILLLALFILYWGAEMALSASEYVGYNLGLSPLAIGLLLVGLGTSLPELFVSHLACMRGESAMALGNIIGSNVGNLFLILGLTALVVPLSLEDKKVRPQLFLHLIVTLVMILVLLPPRFYPLSGISLFAIFIYFLFQTYTGLKLNETEEVSDKKSDDRKKIIKDHKRQLIQLGKLLMGFYALYYGGELLIIHGTNICKYLNISTYVISAIFIAFGTSFPELMTSMVACMKKKDTDLIVGNIIGSNIFNISFVLGSLGMYDFDIEGEYYLESLAVFLGGVVLYFIHYYHKVMNKLAGISFLAVYAAIVYYWVTNIKNIP